MRVHSSRCLGRYTMKFNQLDEVNAADVRSGGRMQEVLVRSAHARG